MRISNTRDDIHSALSILPKNSKCIIESSSVWYGPLRFMQDELDLDVILSNLHHTKAIAVSKKKTDKIRRTYTFRSLSEGYISECYVSEEKVVDLRQLVRYRTKMVRNRAKRKNYIYSITLQKRIKILETPLQICISTDC